MVSVSNFEILHKYKEDFLTIFLLYLIAHGGIFFILDAIYWDDWTLYQVTSFEIMDLFRQGGSMFNLAGYMHNFLLSIGPWFYRFLTFILMFSSGLILYFILLKNKYVNDCERFLIVLLFCILPFYSARVALIDMGYTLCYFLFFFAWLNIEKNRLIALALFFLSFNTNSLLVFYALPFLDSYLRSNDYSWRFKSLIKFSFKKLDFLLLPFFYFFIKIYFYSPSGLYSGYNQSYNLVNLIYSPAVMIVNWLDFNVPLLLTIFISFLVFLYLRLNQFNSYFKNNSSRYYIVFGALIFLLGAFPYWILGHSPVFTDWGSRHQLLLPLGFSLTLVGLLPLFHAYSIRYLIALIISLCLTSNIKLYSDYYFDWQKQKQLISLLSLNSDIRAADIIIFNDLTASVNAVSRIYRAYEWNGLMAQAFGDEKRMGFDLSDYKKFIEGSLFRGYYQDPVKFKAKDFIFKEKPIVINILITKVHGGYSMNLKKIRPYKYNLEVLKNN